MQKSEFIYNAVSILYSVMVQSTIAIENYFNATVAPFNPKVLEYYGEWCEYYDNAMDRFKKYDERWCDAALIFYLRRTREEQIKLSLTYIQKHIINKIGIDYNINEKYKEYESKKEIENPFEQILLDVRELEDKKTQGRKSETKPEGEEMAIAKELLWFTEDELNLMPKFKGAQDMDDGELGGHITHRKVIKDTSFLLSKEQRQEIYEHCVLGVVHDAE